MPSVPLGHHVYSLPHPAHRLKVYIVRNARRDAHVRQEIVAYLGSIDAGSVGCGDERLSIAARIAFWEVANPRLENLANRLGDDMKRLRMAVHARIPWPMEPERARLSLLQAEYEAKMWHGLYSQTGKMIEDNEGLIAKSQENIKELRRDGLNEIGQANKWLAKAAEIRQQLKGDKPYLAGGQSKFLTRHRRVLIARARCAHNR